MQARRAFDCNGVNHFCAVSRCQGELNGLAVVAGYAWVWADACAVGVDADDHVFNRGGAVAKPAEV